MPKQGTWFNFDCSATRFQPVKRHVGQWNTSKWALVGSETTSINITIFIKRCAVNILTQPGRSANETSLRKLIVINYQMAIICKLGYNKLDWWRGIYMQTADTTYWKPACLASFWFPWFSLYVDASLLTSPRLISQSLSSDPGNPIRLCVACPLPGRNIGQEVLLWAKHPISSLGPQLCDQICLKDVILAQICLLLSTASFCLFHGIIFTPWKKKGVIVSLKASHHISERFWIYFHQMKR